MQPIATRSVPRGPGRVIRFVLRGPDRVIRFVLRGPSQVIPAVLRGPSRRLRCAMLCLAVLASPVAVSAFASSPPAAAPAEDDPFAGSPVLESRDLVEAVLDRNPSLEASRQAWQAARAREPQARGLDDPVLNYAFAPLSIPSDEPSFGHSIGLRQRFPFPGKRGLRGDAAAAEAEAARGDMEAVRLRLASMAVSLHADYMLVERALEINDEHQLLVAELRRSAVARYTAGEGSADEPLTAEVEAAQLTRRQIQLRANRVVARARINALLHREPDAALPPPAVFDPREPRPETGVSWRSPVLEDRPELRAAEARLRGRRALSELAGKASYPDFSLMAEYNSMWAMTEHQWMVGVSLDLPLRTGTRRGERDEARARLERSARDRDALVDHIKLEIKAGTERVSETAEILDLFEDRLLPASRDRVTAARASYQTGRISFLHVIEAERDLRRVQLQHEETRAEHVRAQAELDRALGRTPGLPREGE